MSAPSTDPGESYSGPRVLKPDPKLTPRQIVVNVMVCGAFVVFWLVWTGTWPLPRGEENSDQAAAEFLKQEFHGRALSPDAHDDSTGPVAAVFYIIQSGDAPDTTKAVQFATEQNLGYASPYVIERLESDSPPLRQAARQFLLKMAGRDLGPDPQPWQAWWRDPPRRLLGIVTVGHHSTQVGIPIAGGLLGVFLLMAGLRRRDTFFSTMGGSLLAVSWFLIISTAGIQLVGSVNTVTFGGTEILYYTDHGVVEGLSDARAGGFQLWLLLCLTFVAGPFVIMAGLFVVSGLWNSVSGK
ncbi:hypothetical protein [Gimesia panareensis]|uniref:hypothetical protein n=1 Tax=Gimesia panareensis TaxID=2527978 RepID=UPI00118995CF|nr:hypothetical protein [Gimesia panareensis]QDU49465.1 hypothetical protein Pan110_18020 [Gimesia panareensis]